VPYICPQCGAAFPSDETCQDRFNVSQLTEVEQMSYYAVHHLSVLCYMLQHNGYSRDGWLGARELLFQFVYHGLTPAMARRQNRKSLDSGHRTWSITKGPKLPGVENIVWRYTIAEVRLDTAEHYCTDVRHWAETILADTEHLIIPSDDAD
jgi:hypothetical protein